MLELRMSIVAFLLLISSSKDIRGKRYNKKITKALKKHIRVNSKDINNKDFSILVNDTDELIDNARSNMKLESTGLIENPALNPGLMLIAIESRINGFLERIKISREEVLEYGEIFNDHKVSLITIMFVNKIHTLLIKEHTE